jgi:hypothetical protein
MKTQSRSFETVMRATLMFTVLVIAMCYPMYSQAAQGCGSGYHRAYNGKCIGNHPHHNNYLRRHGCWMNAWGVMHCR